MIETGDDAPDPEPEATLPVPVPVFRWQHYYTPRKAAGSLYPSTLDSAALWL